MDVPVYLFTGFMDSGKTTLLKSSLLDEDFAQGNNLVIVCEEGDVEYEQEEFLKYKVNVVVLQLDDESELTEDFLEDCAKQYQPDQVFIEYNGTWQAATILDLVLPDGWELIQQLTTVDAGSYEMYLTNMRTMMMEQVFNSDVVIFNRCTEDTPKAKFRRSVKARNPKAQCVFEREDGSIDDSLMEERPYDMTQDVIEITDADFGLFYLDVQESQEVYDGKTVRFLGLVYRPEERFGKKPVFVCGRFAMTCCVEDIQYIGFKCKYDKGAELGHRSWVWITAKIRYEFVKEYRGKGPVLYAQKVESAQKPDEELVYFN